MEKEPTAAHHAIAALASRGFIKVIVTTNFDNLMERALSAAGIEPTAVSTADQIEGAPPLDHIRHLVFKVHGDYLDTRILNTEKELAAYPPQVDALLDRIFDEYGLIICGWPGDWDPALRRALERASSRRYTTYWTTRRRGTLQALLFLHAFWDMDLSRFVRVDPRGLAGWWPQGEIGVILWGLSAVAEDWKNAAALTALCTIPDDELPETCRGRASSMFVWRILWPLHWFGFLEYRGPEETRDVAWRKSVLFDRFLSLEVRLSDNRGSSH